MHRRLSILALALLTAATLSAEAQHSADGDIPAPMFPESGAFGVVVHTPFHGEALDSVGVQWVRVNTRWRNVEKDSRGQYDWEATDKLLHYYLDHGFRVMNILTVERLCPLYEGDKDIEDVVIDAITEWAGAMAARYKGKGILWEIGNEPECFPMDGYWNNPATYTKMARKVAKAVKAADPDAKTAALSVAWFDRGFISGCLEAGLLSDGAIDVLSYHGYHRRTLLPESGLAEDVAWLRNEVPKFAPEGKHIVLADSERGYAIVDFLEPKSWSSWRNITYCEAEQAAYGARHYLETVYLGVEIAVWYKDMRGEHCYSLYYGTDEDAAGLRRVGHVYRNLAALPPDNPKRLRNERYTVSLTDPPDNVSAPDGLLCVRSYLRSYVEEGQAKDRLGVAAWNPVEAFDGKILDNRKRMGDHFYEAWRAVSPDDGVEIPTRIRIAGLNKAQVSSMALYDLTAESTAAALGEPLAAEAEDDAMLSPTLEIGPMPTILVVDLK